jgi:hypothetical protein
MSPFAALAALAALSSCMSPSGGSQVRIQAVDIPVVIKADFPWPGEVKMVRVMAVECSASVSETSPSAGAALQAHLMSLMKNRMPSISFQDASSFGAVLTENPNAKFPAADAMLMTRLNGAKVHAGPDGSLMVEAALVVRLVSNRDGSVIFVSDLLDRVVIPATVRHAWPPDQAAHMALDRAMQTLASRSVDKMAGGTRRTRIFLIDAGPLTLEGIRRAAAADLAAAKARFEEGAATEAESSAAFYNLASLARVEGHEAEAAEYMRKAEGGR